MSNDICTQTEVMVDDNTEVECLTCIRYGTTIDGVSKGTHNDEARIYISKDNDPFAYVGPLLYDDTSSGREASTTSSLGHSFIGCLRRDNT